MQDSLVEDIIAAAGEPIASHTLSVEEMRRAVEEGRVLEVYYWSHFGEGEASFGFATDFGVDNAGRVAPGYIVFPNPIPPHLRRTSDSNWEKGADVYAAFGIDASRPVSVAAPQPQAVPAHPADPLRHQHCSICSQLDDWNQASQEIQGSEDDTYLPDAADKLKTVRDIKPGHPGLRLEQCPECGTYYLFYSIYEFLIPGSYDGYYLVRMTDEVGADYLSGRLSEPLKGMGYH